MRTDRLIVTFGIGAALLSTAVPVVGQGGGTAAPAAVSRPWPPARLADGQPDVQGIWSAVNGGSTSLTNPISNEDDFDRHRPGAAPHKAPSRVIDPPDGQLPYQPWAAARQKQQEHDYDHATKPEHVDPQARCLISGVPRLYTIVPSFKIVQFPGSIAFIWDAYHAYRVIPLDGRPHIAPSVKLWMGDARGHWEGNTLVVDTTNVRGARLTYLGDFHSDSAHILERFTFVDANTINYEATVDDPTVFTRPWTMRIGHQRRPDDEIWEMACYEGNKDPDRLLLKPDTEAK